LRSTGCHPVRYELELRAFGCRSRYARVRSRLVQEQRLHLRGGVGLLARQRRSGPERLRTASVQAGRRLRVWLLCKRTVRAHPRLLLYADGAVVMPRVAMSRSERS
jgi:hypothetical protein